MTHFLVTAGPTREYIDDVRYLSNASSGRMGYALVKAILALGHGVHLVSGPLELPPPKGAKVTRVVSAQEMERAVRASAKEADILIMAAAVADYRPAFRAKGKIKKSGRPGRDGRTSIDLVENPDILAGLGRRRLRKGQFLVGFALEAERLLENAGLKLQAKRVDLLVANGTASLGGEKTRITLLGRGGDVEEWPVLTKAGAAKRLIKRCLELWASERTGS